jgi:mxaK protein
MNKRIKYKNALVCILLVLGLAGAVYEVNEYRQLSAVNDALMTGKVLKGDNYLLQQKFSYGYEQAKANNYKHAIQAYGQMLEASKQTDDNSFEMDEITQSNVQFNLANSFFRAGLQRSVNSDGTMHEEAMYAFTQAKRTYKQALKTNPNLEKAKFNLSLLLSIMPGKMKLIAKEQSSMVISNLPQGLP